MKNYSPFNLDDITLTITAIDPENHHIGTEMPNPEGVPTSRMNMAKFLPLAAMLPIDQPLRQL